MRLAADSRNPLKSRNIYPRNDEAGLDQPPQEGRPRRPEHQGELRRTSSRAHAQPPCTHRSALGPMPALRRSSIASTIISRAALTGSSFADFGSCCAQADGDRRRRRRARRSHLHRADQRPVLIRSQRQSGRIRRRLKLAIERGWLWKHESGTYVKLTQAGADLFA